MLISLEELETDRIVFQPVYFLQNISGAVDKCYMRKGTGQKLLKAVELLQTQYKFKIFDAWRPYEVQKSLFDKYYNIVKRESDSILSEAEIMEKVKEFVSFPSKDPKKPFVHATGGAIDLTIIKNDGTELDMGTTFDDFTETAHTKYFEKSNKNSICYENREMLCRIMEQAGFSNLETEWWHYDYGDEFWANSTGKEVIYEGILSIDQKKL